MVALVIGLAVTATWSLTADVGYFMSVAQRVSAGERLYVDLQEVNSPLAIWLLLGGSATLGAVGIEDPRWPPVAVGLAQLALSLVLSLAILRRTRGVSESDRWWLLALLVIAALWLPASDFANREHQTFVLLVPYLLVTASLLSEDGFEDSRTLRFATGALAGVALAFKPHFVLAGIAFEVALWCARGRPRRWMRPESVAAAIIVVAFAVSVIIFAPGYVPLVRTLGSAYVAVFNKPIVFLLVDPQTVVAGVACLLGLALAGRGGTGRQQWVFGVAGLVLLAVALVQRKGWNYHYFAALACATTSLGLAVLHPPSGRALRRVIGSTVGLMLAVAAWRWEIWLTARPRQRAQAAQVRALVAKHAPDRRVLVISWDIGMQYPTVTELGLHPTTGYPSFWQLAVVFGEECDSTSAAIRGQVLDALRQSLPRDRLPGLLMIDRRGGAAPGCGTLLDFLSTDPAIRAALERYRPLSMAGELHAYALKSGSDSTR